MSVVRVHKTKNFTVMSNTHFKEKKMSLKAKGLLSLMLSLPDDWDYSIAGLVTLSKDGKDSVMTALAELEEFGYLTRSRLTDKKGRFSGVEYQIFEVPNPVADKSNSANAKEEKSNEENPPQLNTELTNLPNNQELKKPNKNIEEPNLSIYENILEEIEDKELRQLYRDYIDMRFTINSPVSQRALSMLIDRCARISNFNITLQKEMIEAAVINNWKSVHLPNTKEDPPKGGGGGERKVFNRESRFSASGYDALKNFNLNSQDRGWEIQWEIQQFSQKKQQWG